MTDRRHELYQAVLSDPDSLEPRLAMATWLDEQGDPQGEFIRLQIAAAKEPGRVGSRRYAELCEAADKLLAKHGAAWANSITCLSPRGFIRGFVEQVLLTAREFLASAPSLYTRAPIRQLILLDAWEVVDELVGSPLLDRIVSLSMFQSRLDDRAITKLAASTHLGKLKALNLGFNDIGQRGLDALCASERLPSLVYLNLAGNKVKEPIEEYGEEYGRVVREGAYLDAAGRAVEERFGYRKWFHGPSLLPNYPPWDDEL